MKIALYSQYFVSKFEYMENGFSREFQRLGHDVIIVTGVKRYPKLYSEALEIKLGQNKISPGEYDENGIKIVRLEMRETGLQGNIGIPKRFISNLKKYSIDIIFFQSLELYQAAVLAVITKYYLRCKLYMVVNEHYVHKNTSGNPKINSRFKYFKKFLKKLIKRAILKLSDRVIGMNEYSSMVAKKICPSVESKLVEVTLAVDHYNIYFKPDFRIIIRKKYGISDDNIVIIHTGKLLPFKKTDVLVQAVGIINDPKIRIMLVGHGPENYLNKIKKIAISYGIDNHCCPK